MNEEDLLGYCIWCDEPVSKDEKHYRDTIGNLCCSEECKKELDFNPFA